MSEYTKASFLSVWNDVILPTVYNNVMEKGSQYWTPFQAITLTWSNGHAEPLNFILWIILLISREVGGDNSNREVGSSKIFIHNGGE